MKRPKSRLIIKTTHNKATLHFAADQREACRRTVNIVKDATVPTATSPATQGSCRTL